MSDGHKIEEKRLVTVDPEEFNEIVKRVHEFLVSRADKAKEKKDTRPTAKADQIYIENVKDAYVFAHMVELIEHMSEEISDLRDILASVGGFEDQKSAVSSFELFSADKKNYIN